MAKYSTGLRNKMQDDSGFRTLMTGSFLKIYGSTAAPASADAAVPGGSTLLCTLSDNGGVGGLNFETPTSAVIQKAIAQIWKGVNAATGSALWFRVVTAADDGSLSDTAYRVQGTCGTVNADMLMSNTLMTATEEFVLNNFASALPSL